MNLEELFLLNTNESLKKYVDNIINNITQNTEHEDKIGFEHPTPHKGFIDNSTIITNVDSFWKIKNNNYAYQFVWGLKKMKVTNLNDAMNKIYALINAYFGEYNNNQLRKEIIAQNPFGVLDISLLAGKKTAVCSERAAIAQNLFSILGVESYYITGYVSDSKGGEPHAFNLIKHNNKFLLYDASKDIPQSINGKTIYVPFISELSLEQVELLFNEKEIIVRNRMYKSFGTYKGKYLDNGYCK